MTTTNKNFKVKNGLDVSGTATASSFVKAGGSAVEFLMADGSVSSGGGGSSLEVSETPPSSPALGDIWYNSQTGQTFVYYDSYWVENIAGVAGPTGPAGPSLTLTANDVARINGWADNTVEIRARSFATANFSPSNTSLFVSYFRPAVNMTVSQVSGASGATAATSVTTGKLGLYQINQDQASGTLLARTANDTTLFTVANTVYTRNFDTSGGYPATVGLTAGTLYGIAQVVVGATAGSRATYPNTQTALNSLSPRNGGTVVSQTDLPATFSAAASPAVGGLWGRLS